MDPAGGTSFVAMGTTRLQSVPFAYYANGVNADNVDGILSASKGGTGVASISALKTALAIDQINNTSDLAKPISTSTQAALDTKVSTTTFSTTIAAKAPIDSPTFTGTVAGITKAMVGLGSVNNTSDLEKPISTLTQEALDTKVSTATFSTTVATKANVTDLALKAPIESPTFTGTVAGITKAMVGLGSVNNTTDLAKPISTATQEALDTKVSASTFSTTLATKVSTETFSSTVATKENAANKSTATDLGGSTTSDILFPTQKAVKTYVDAQVNAGGVADGGITTNKLAAGAVTDEKVASGINKVKVGLGNVDNTADLDKPLSTATILALADKPSIDVRRVAKLDEPNFFTGDQQISGNLSLSNGILNLAGGTQIQSGSTSSTILQNRIDTDFSILTNDDGITEHEFRFGRDGYIVFDQTTGIGRENGSFNIVNEGDINLVSSGNIVLGDPNEMGSSFKFEIDNSVLKFPQGSAEIYSSDDGYFGMQAKLDGIFEIFTRNSGDDFETEDDDIYNYWEFQSNGILEFPDGTEMGSYYSNGPPIFKLSSSSGFYIVSGEPGEERNLGAGILISPDEARGEVRILTREYNENEGEISNSWSYDSQGKLTFPDGTTLAGNYSGSSDFEIETQNKAFSIRTVNDNLQNIFEWNFEQNGSLNLPILEAAPSNVNLQEGSIAIAQPSGWDPLSKGGSVAYPVFYNGTDWVGLGSSVATGSSTPTNILYVDPSLNTNYNTILANENGFKFQFYQDGVGLDKQWSYNMDGSLTFPDGTITSGNISNTNTFGFDTRATANGLSIITPGTITGTSKLWEFKTDGVLNLPGSASVGMVYNLPYYFQEGLQITTPNAFILKSLNPGKVWRFEANGNTVFPGDLGIEGNLSQVNNINASSIQVTNLNASGSLRINDENILDKFKSQIISLSGGSLSVFNGNTTHSFILNAEPRSGQITMFVNGMRINKSEYSVNSTNVSYRKLVTNYQTEVEVQFDYIKN
jgi:hypothetical protein